MTNFNQIPKIIGITAASITLSINTGCTKPQEANTLELPLNCVRKDSGELINGGINATECLAKNIYQLRINLGGKIYTGIEAINQATKTPIKLQVMNSKGLQIGEAESGDQKPDSEKGVYTAVSISNKFKTGDRVSTEGIAYVAAQNNQGQIEPVGVIFQEYKMYNQSRGGSPNNYQGKQITMQGFNTPGINQPSGVVRVLDGKGENPLTLAAIGISTLNKQKARSVPVLGQKENQDKFAVWTEEGNPSQRLNWKK
jgi:hypothetical protein